jgi:hypothetical protein
MIMFNGLIYDIGNRPELRHSLHRYLRHCLTVLFKTVVTDLIYDTGYRSYLRHWLPALFTTLLTGIIYDIGYRSDLRQWLPA